MQVLTDEKKQFISQMLDKPLIARMATADLKCQPHVVPVWFGWDGESLWISSFSNTRKVKELELNPKISVVVDLATAGGETKGVLFEGIAVLVKEPREVVRSQSLWIYTRYLGKKGVQEQEPQSWIHDPLNLVIRLKPQFVHTWSY